MNKNIFLGVILLVLVTSCDFFSGFMQVEENNTGSVEFTISEAGLRTFAPENPLVISHYTVTLRKEGEDDIVINNVPVNTPSLRQQNLVFGDWTITVDAYDSEDKKIATGMNTITVSIGENSSCTIVVTPLVGSGALNLSISWPSEALVTPRLEASLVSNIDINSSSDFIFSVVSNEETLVTTGNCNLTFASGYYTLYVKLFEDGEDSPRYATSIITRIVNGEITSGILELTTADLVAEAIVKPTFSPDPGEFDTTQTIILSSETPGVEIWYTLNGTPPAKGIGFLYDTPFDINTTATVKAIVVSDSGNESSIGTVKYTITDTISSPNVSINEGVYYGTIKVGLQSETENTGIIYTIDGSDPVMFANGMSLADGELIEINNTITIKALAFDNTNPYNVSDIMSATYTITGFMVSPVFSLDSGVFYNNQTLDITSADEGTKIYYTVDGTEPSSESMLYEGSLTIDKVMTVKAISITEDWCDSYVVTKQYDMTVDDPDYIISGERINSRTTEVTYNNEQTVELLTSTANANIYYTLDISEPDSETGFLYLDAPLYISSNTTLKIIGSRTDWYDSNIKSIVINLVCADPVFSTVGGIYNTEKSTTISTATTGASIYYTVDDSIDLNEETGTLYAGEVINITQSETLRAIVIKDGYTDSEVISENYELVVPEPNLTPEAGSSGIDAIILSSDLDSVSYIYTLDGSNPSYTVPFNGNFGSTINTSGNADVVVKVKAFRYGWTDSQIVRAVYNADSPVCENPVFSVSGGTYNTDQSLTISSATADASIYYTFDEGIVLSAENGTLYSGETITIDQNRTLSVIVVKDGYIESDTITETYNMVVPDPTISPDSGSLDVTTVTLSNTLDGVSTIYTTDGTEPTSDNGTIGDSIDITDMSDVTIKVISIREGWIDSQIFTYKYNQPVCENALIDVTGGTYNSNQTVTITSDTADAYIYYTFDTEVTLSKDTGILYEDPIVIDNSKTLRVLVTKDGYLDSEITSETYELVVPDPTYSPETGSSGIETVTISSELQGVTFIYTLDDTTPSSDNGNVGNTIDISALGDVTVKILSTKDGWIDSQVVTAIYYQGVCSNTVFDVDGGTYNSEQTITLTNDTEGCSIYYTFDDELVLSSETGTLYETPIVINGSKTLRAIAVKENYVDSEIVSATYEMVVPNPTFTPETGSSSVTTVTFNSELDEVLFIYTTDGIDPVVGSYGTVDTSLDITGLTNVTLKVIAYKADWTSSEIVTASYNPDI